MKKLIVHIGHGKTGTSFLQTVFSLNKESLKQLGFEYPNHMDENLAKNGYNTFGNGRLLLKNDIQETEHDKVLYSSELLFRKLAYETEHLASLSNRFNLEVILYTRDVIEHSVSKWGQYVKQGGGFQDLNTFLTHNYNDVLPTVLEWIRLSKDIGFTLNLRNYSKCKSSLVDDFFRNVLQIQGKIKNLNLPSQRVNRSLSFSEYEIQRVFNAAFGVTSSNYISDFLYHEFPSVAPYKPTISEQAYDHIYNENVGFVDSINLFLQENERLIIGDKEKWVSPNKEHTVTLDNEICMALGMNIKKNLKTIETNDIDTLRDIAITLADEHNDLSGALSIMKIALHHRPWGNIIINKVEQWSNILATSDK